MSSRRKLNWIEWGFVAFLVVACAMLSVLQYRWTGEIAQAEAERLRTSLEEQSQLMCRAFDAELSSNCRQFFVTRSEVEDLGADAAILQRHREWLANHPRPLFRRIAIARYNDEKFSLQSMDADVDKLTPMEWPAEWAPFRENFTARMERRGRYSGYSTGATSSTTTPSNTPAGSSSSLTSTSSYPSYLDPDGVTFDFSMPTTRDFDGEREGAWIIFELDMDYLRHTWLPELVRNYLNASGRPANEVTVKTTSEPVKRVFTSGEGEESAEGGEEGAEAAPFAVRFNKQLRSFTYSRPLMGEGRWLLETRYRPGALEAAVSGTRQRNLGVALVVNALILGMGVAIVRHTRRSRQLAEAQMNFVANVSHELRTPLTVIRSAAHNLEKGVVKEPEGIAQYASLIQAHAENLAEMVEQILALAAARRRKEANREPVAIMDVLAGSVAACEPETRAAGCKVVMEVPDDLPKVEGDSGALRRVFQNLISNAAKHAGTGGWVGISARTARGTEVPTVQVKVWDKGPGIPKEEHAAVFEPFVRGSAAQEAHTRGSGLGLSLVREIVKLHGGTVSLASEPGQGAIFTVTIPST